MKTKFLKWMALLGCIFLFFSCKSGENKGGATDAIYAKPAKEISQIYNKFERLKYQLIGHFSNRFQVMEENSGEPVQEFIVMPILQKDRPGEFWVYLEFFSPLMIDKPIDQRVEQYVQLSRDTFVQEVYYLKEPERFVNAWKNNRFPELNTKEDLIKDEACDLIIIHQENDPGTYRTIFPEEVTCEMLTSTTAARYVDLMYETDDHGYIMWFTFYDRNKNLLKRTKEQGLNFKRLSPEDMGYIDLSRKNN